MSFKVSPTSMQDFYKQGSCKRNWFERRVTKTIPRDPPSEQMIKGLVFETLALGENVSGEEMPDHRFLYTKNGKSVELQRIEQQADKFKRLTDSAHEEFIGFEVRETQVRIENDFMKGVMDIVGKTIFEEDVISDLKFTADVESTYGDYAWGRDPNEINWDQIASYKGMWRDNFESSKDPKTNLIVFDASPRMGVKFFDIKLSDNYISDVYEKARSVTEYVDRVNNGDIDIVSSVSPSKNNCEACPIEDCPFRFKQTVKKIKVYV